MGLFNKKQPEVGDPVFIDMRISEEQLSEEDLSQLRGQMWFMGFPEKLSDWTITTLGIICERSSDLFRISFGTTLSIHRLNFHATDNVSGLSNDYILRQLREARCNFNPPRKPSLDS